MSHLFKFQFVYSLRSTERISNRVMAETRLFCMIWPPKKTLQLFRGEGRHIHFRPCAFFRVLCNIGDFRVLRPKDSKNIHEEAR